MSSTDIQKSATCLTFSTTLLLLTLFCSEVFTVGIAFACFYHAERVLSAIAKVSCSPPWGKRERDEMREGTGTGREWGRKQGVARNENARKNSHKTTDLAFGDASWELMLRVIHFWKLFSGKTFLLQIVCLYLEPFRSNIASNWQSRYINSTYLILLQIPYIFRKLFLCATFTSQVVRLYLEPSSSYLASKLTILRKFSKIQHIWPYGEATWGYTTSYRF